MYDRIDKQVVTNLEQLGKSSVNKVVLTFDDGPSRVLPQILEILERENVKAMFFWQSRLLYDERPWRRVIKQGHIIGSHSINHKNLIVLDCEGQYRQIYKSKQTIEKMIGREVTYFRPPFGRYNEDTLCILNELDIVPIMWEITAYDWELKEQPERIIQNVVENINDGSIILLHELKQTVAILPQLIRDIRSAGYEFALL